MPLDAAADTTAQANVAVTAPPTDFLALAREAYLGSSNYFDTAVRRDLIDDLRRFQSLHPQASKYLSPAYAARNKFFRPKTRAAVRKGEAIGAAAYFTTQDAISIKPIDDDDPLQSAGADILKHLVEYRLKHSIPWFLLVTGALQDAQVQGVVASYQCWEYDKRKGINRPAVHLRPLENLRWDPNASWHDPVNTSPYFIELIPMYVKDVKARMRQIDKNTGQAKWKFIADSEIRKAATASADVVRLQREQGRADPRAQPSAIGDYTIVWVHRNIVEVDGQDYVYHTLATVDMLDTPRPLRDVYFHGLRPYVIGFCAIETHRQYPGGPARLGAQIQAEINQNANQRADNIAFAMNKRWFVKRTAQVDLNSLRRNSPGSITLMNNVKDGEDVRIVETNDVTGSAFEEQDRLNLDFDDVVGTFSQSSVQSNRRLNETVGGMSMLRGDASQLAGYLLTTFNETWTEPVLTQLVALERHYEDDEKILALAAKRAQLIEKHGIEELTDAVLLQEVAVDVNVGLSAVNPHDQLTNFFEGLKALRDLLADGTLISYGIDVGEIQREIFGKLGYKDGKRFFPGDEDPQFSALLGQVQALKQALAAKHPPEIVAAQVKKLMAEVGKINNEAVKVGVEAGYSAVQTAEVVAAVPRVAPVADKILEMAGYQRPSPPGVDPDLPTAAPGADIGIEPLKNKRTGMVVDPSAANTDPMGPANVPQPASPAVGAARGIETQRADGAPQ